MLLPPCFGDSLPSTVVESITVVASPDKSWPSDVVGYTREIDVVDGINSVSGLVVIVTGGVELNDVEASVGIGPQVDATIPLVSRTSPDPESAGSTVDDSSGW